LNVSGTFIHSLPVIHTDATSAQTAVNRTVRIRADDQVARRDVPGFHQNQVRDSGVHIVKLVDPVGAREIAAYLLIGGVLLGFGGRDVVQDHGQPVRIVELGRADLLHDADRSPRRRVTHHQVGIGVDDLTRPHGSPPGLGGENFFGNRKTQFEALLLT
jgi:hypothetical protein